MSNVHRAAIVAFVQHRPWTCGYCTGWALLVVLLLVLV